MKRFYLVLIGITLCAIIGCGNAAQNSEEIANTADSNLDTSSVATTNAEIANTASDSAKKFDICVFDCIKGNTSISDVNNSYEKLSNDDKKSIKTQSIYNLIKGMDASETITLPSQELFDAAKTCYDALSAEEKQLYDAESFFEKYDGKHLDKMMEMRDKAITLINKDELTYKDVEQYFIFCDYTLTDDEKDLVEEVGILAQKKKEFEDNDAEIAQNLQNDIDAISDLISKEDYMGALDKIFDVENNDNYVKSDLSSIDDFKKLCIDNNSSELYEKGSSLFAGNDIEGAYRYLSLLEGVNSTSEYEELYNTVKFMHDMQGDWYDTAGNMLSISNYDMAITTVSGKETFLSDGEYSLTLGTYDNYYEKDTYPDWVGETIALVDPSGKCHMCKDTWLNDYLGNKMSSWHLIIYKERDADPSHRLVYQYHRQEEAEHMAKLFQNNDGNKSNEASDSTDTESNTCFASGCHKKGTHTIIGLNGTPEYYCDEHYKEITDIVGEMEESVGSGKYSEHTCEVAGCNKEGTHRIMGLNGTYEYYCTDHYNEMKEIMNSFTNGD